MPANFSKGLGRNLVEKSASGMLKMMAKLPAAYFVQIHRSTLINLRHMRKASTAPFGEYMVELTNGHKLKVTRTFVHNLKAHL